MASIFTKIVNKEIPSYTVYETDKFLAFLDIHPNTRGHTLCIPKKESDKLFDLSQSDYSQLMDFAYKVAQGIGKVISCQRVALEVIGLEVPHVHVQLIPINTMADAVFQNKVKVCPEEMDKIAQQIHDAII